MSAKGLLLFPLRRGRKVRSTRSRNRHRYLMAELLESRVVLSADPVLSVISDQTVNEAAPLNLVDIGTFSDAVEGAPPIGRNPAAFATLGTFDPTSNVVISTNGPTPTMTGGITASGVLVDGVAVFAFSSFELDAGISITATGTHPVALLSHTDLTVAGTINVSASLTGPGAGGGAGGQVSQADGSPAYEAPVTSVGKGAPSNSSGGSGGAHGGNGGNSNAAGGGLAALGGEAFGDLQLGLSGGSGGGAASLISSGGGGRGGSGGGAVELGAVRSITVSATGIVNAAGSNGTTFFSSGTGFYGGGGGAGGGILVHGFDVSFHGQLNAKGGNGGIGQHGSGGGGGGGRILIARDVDGGYNATGVHNVAGGIQGGGASSTAGQAGSFEVIAVQSTGVAETYDYVIDWGDGTTADSGSATVDQNGTPGGSPNLGSFDGTHIYPEPGVYIVTVTVNDSGGGSDTDTFFVTVRNLVDIAGRVYDDLNNDGVYQPLNGETGIGGVTIEVWDDALSTLYGSTTTAADGTYSLDTNLDEGNYRIVEVVDELATLGLLDGKETAGNLGGTVDNGQDSNSIGIRVGAPGTTPDAVDYLFAEIRPSEISGFVWEDFNNDGAINFGEFAVEGVEITLEGTDDRGIAVSATLAVTDVDGAFAYFHLRPGVYSLTAVQPAGLVDGREAVGTVNGVARGFSPANDQCSGIELDRPDSVGRNYNFGERPQTDGGASGSSQAAGSSFWQNNKGQSLIKSLNGGESATQLGNWLGATFPNMYGAHAGANDLRGKTNGEVASFFDSVFRQKKKQTSAGGPAKTDAQILATALSVYVSNENLAGTAATAYGFSVTRDGLGIKSFNVGTHGGAFGVADHSNVTVLDLLLAVDARTTSGLIGDLDGDGDADDSLETQLRQAWHEVFGTINELGGI